MSSPYNNIETKAELAFLRHINTIGTRISGVTIHAGVDPSNLPLPYVVANAIGAEEHIFGSGQYAVELDIDIVSSADDTTADTHRQRVAYVRDELANDWVSISLSGYVTDFTAVGVVLQKSLQTIEDRHWITSIPMIIHCRPSD